MVTAKQLRNLPVATESGEQIGRVVDFEIEPENHQIVVYLVSPNRLTRPITHETLRVSCSQVLSITPERMVVEDNVKLLRARGRTELAKGITSAVPSPTG